MVAAFLALVGLEMPTFAQTAQQVEPKPPEVFIDKGACPFEGCAYRDWTVDADTQLYDGPGGKKLAILLKKGGRVTGLTGEVHVKPQLVRVLRDQPSVKDGKAFSFRKGEVFYLLTYLGEGEYQAWYKGEVIQVAPDFVWQGANTCSDSPEGCWAKPEGKYQATWWVKVRLESGAEGWSNEPDNFGNKDSLGD